MYCLKCGAQLPDGSAFCNVCGQPQINSQQPNNRPQQNYQQGYQQQNYQQNYPQQNYQQGYRQPVYQQQAYQQPIYQQAQPLGMKWYKFLAYFALWLAAVGNIVNGISILNNDTYGALEDPNGVYGIFCILIGVFCAITAFCLLKFKKNGPKLLNFTLLNSAVGTLVYVIWVAAIASDYGADVTQYLIMYGASFLLSLVILWLNKIYYRKRAYLFVN